MKYKSFEVKLKTNKTRDYLWNKINTPKKLMKLEEFPMDSEVKQISQYNYEFYFGNEFAFLTFIPNRGVTMVFSKPRDDSIAWFEIEGEENCTIVHGTSIRMDIDNGQWYKENKIKLNEHFLDELGEWAK